MNTTRIWTIKSSRLWESNFRKLAAGTIPAFKFLVVIELARLQHPVTPARFGVISRAFEPRTLLCPTHEGYAWSSLKYGVHTFFELQWDFDQLDLGTHGPTSRVS